MTHSDETLGRGSLKDIFAQALELPAEQREAFLDKQCGNDARLRAAVEELLAAHDRAGGFLAGSTPPGVRQIGPYKILQAIGEGGFGTVYLAEQERPVRRRVALKVIKLGMDTQQVIARFEAERQALAMMDHPNIARVFDAGATEAGRPYFVMELVGGVPVTEYCDQKRLTPRERLELFLPICQAIQHAHQKGIIHRDLKPSNVLVATSDGRAVPKVIDFGIAKATQSRLTEKTLFTEFRQMIGTPEYMSPEQAEVSAQDVDTRSDVYSLGVLLYELLTGSTPFGARELQSKAYGEIQRVIREVDPQRPSTRLSTTETIASVAAQRNVEPRRLQMLVRGELDWIVMKCLEKDRGRRYESASALAGDVSHFLADEPVSAAAPSRVYRFRKFVRRNRGAVFASAALVVLLIAGITGTTIGLIGQSRQRKIAEQQRGEAQRQAAIAEAVARFQGEMLTAADPGRLLGEKVTVMQTIDAALKELDAEKLKDQPLVEAGVREAIGVTLLSLGRYEESEKAMRKSLELRRASLPADSQLVADASNNLGAVLRILRKFGEAETLLRESLESRRRAVPMNQLKVAESLNNLGGMLRDQGKLDAAEPLHRESLAIYRRVLPPGDLGIASGLGNLGAALFELDRPAEAEPFFREALEIRRANEPAAHPETATAVNNLANTLFVLGRRAEAEPLFFEALEIRRKSLPPGHPRLADNLNDVAAMLRSQGKLAEAEPLVREALEIYRKAMPPDHPDIGEATVNLAILLQEQRKFADADPLFKDGEDRFVAAFGKDNWRVGSVRVLRAQNLTELKRYADAESELLEAHRAPAAAKGTPQDRSRDCIEALIALYSAWDKSEPGKGYAAKAESWKLRLPATIPTDAASTRP